MAANKIIFCPASGVGGPSSKVYICLLDEHIYTKCTEREMLDMRLDCGCFIDYKPCTSVEDVIKSAYKFIDGHALKYKDPGEFIELEKKGESERVAKAFATAEGMIQKG